jgi:hypothetical protein
MCIVMSNIAPEYACEAVFCTVMSNIVPRYILLFCIFCLFEILPVYAADMNTCTYLEIENTLG